MHELAPGYIQQFQTFEKTIKNKVTIKQAEFEENKIENIIDI